MAKKAVPSQQTSLSLARLISEEVIGWRNQGYHPFPSETTRQLLAHWFDRGEEADAQFHECQQLAIETVIYLHDVRQIRSLRQLYEEFAPEKLKLFKTIADEVDGTPFLKYCIKSATGSGKTWILAAFVVWQYFNFINGETNAPYSARFMIVTPGLEVRNRILDSFLGRRDPKTGSRLPQTSDYRRPLYMPDTMDWRGRFALLDNVLQPSDIRSNSSPPDAPFIAITNWQQFVMPKDKLTLAEELGLESIDYEQGEVIADFMTEYPDLIVLNDEAHHVHGKKTAKADELVWRRFMGVLNDRMHERHGDSRGLFLQLDFSATPFYGSGLNREYFPHIIYDYDLRDALGDMLVKQLFLEERAQQPGQQPLDHLDFNADRDDDRHVIGLSLGQKRLLDIGLAKLSELTQDFRTKGLKEKPIYMILCEDTTVADFVQSYLLDQKSPGTNAKFTARELLVFHSELKKDKHGYTQEEARGGGGDLGARSYPTLDSIDDNDDPLRVVISVLALREGFDKNNICVITALRSGEADILLEQIVGRGLRLMFPAYKTDATIQDAKHQAVAALRRRESPDFSLDFLYLVEHPRFRDFYDNLRKEGYLIAGGDSSTTPATGDLIPIEAIPDRIPLRDIAWPHAIQEESKLPDLSSIDLHKLPPYRLSLVQQQQMLANLSITDRHLVTDTRAHTWDLRDKNFNYDAYLAHTARVIAHQGKTRVLSSKYAELAAIVDEYTTHRLFRETIDFADEANYRVLADPQLQDFVSSTLRAAVIDLLGQPLYEVRRGAWRRLSDLSRINIREASSIISNRSIYPRMPVSARFGGLERKFMETTLEASAQSILAWCKLQRKHNLLIAYRDTSGLLRNYEVDFIVRTADRNYIIETKADRDLSHPTVGVKAKAARGWCEQISGIAVPDGLQQPTDWEYLLLSESVYAANQGIEFSALVPLMRQTRDTLIAGTQGTLFA